jgi:hypothetical protein
LPKIAEIEDSRNRRDRASSPESRMIGKTKTCHEARRRAERSQGQKDVPIQTVKDVPVLDTVWHAGVEAATQRSGATINNIIDDVIFNPALNSPQGIRFSHVD